MSAQRGGWSLDFNSWIDPYLEYWNIGRRKYDPVYPEPKNPTPEQANQEKQDRTLIYAGGLLLAFLIFKELK